MNTHVYRNNTSGGKILVQYGCIIAREYNRPILNPKEFLTQHTFLYTVKNFKFK